ncbi:hypothetical protein C3L33_19152, partial [Rhododendron williamsianum]
MSAQKEKEKEKKKGLEKQSSKKNRFLITVNVLGSAGPIRFVVNEEDNVKGVIDTALKMYAREGRLPVLGSDVALGPSDSIGSTGGRNFVLCKKQKKPNMTEGRSEMIEKGSGSSWKTWLNKSFNFKVASH